MPRISGGSWLGGCFLYVDYTVASQSQSGNYSDINYTFGIHFGDFFFNCTNRHINWGAGPGTGYGDWNSAPSLPFPGGMGTDRDFPYHSGSVRIYHDDSGNATASVFGSINPSSAGGGGSRSVFGSFAISQIPRFSGPPSMPVISSITSTSVVATFSDGTGGAPIDVRYIFWGTNPSIAEHNAETDGSDPITGLLPGTTYYFWALTHNSAGFSPFSGRATAVTLRVPDAPTSVILSEITQTSMFAVFLGNGDGGTPVFEWQLGYGTDPDDPTDFLVYTTGETVPDLSPATTYYFWGRGRNAVGWGPWSVVSVARTIGGARVKVGDVWKDAIPYVRVGGVWKLAHPWVRIAGVWKETV